MDPRKSLTSIDYRVIIDTLVSLNCPRALTVAILLRHGEYSQIVALRFNPLDYNNLVEARGAYSSTELLRKNRFLETGIDKAAVALTGFRDNEQVCKDTNERLSRGNPDYSGLLFSASRKITAILGDFCVDEWLNSSGWGPGVTLTLRRGGNTLFEKFHHHGEVTPTFYNLAKLLTKRASPLWDVRPKVYEGNRVVTVPKDAKTDRVIAVEPSLNLFFQKGIGVMIRKRLKRWSVDLRDQTRNQGLSRLGSNDGSLATVDFSAASDTIASRLVLELLPFHWFQVLDCVRSSRGLVEGELIEYEKFSSMGNGYTFELESLIFYAIALAVADEAGSDSSSISVYGDDVIIPTNLYDRYSEVCSYVGFTVNKKKSFSTSYFRESCGAYFWNGVSIKPIRLLDSLSSEHARISFHNRLYEYRMQEEFLNEFSQAPELLLRSSVQKISTVPTMFGDVGFYGEVPPKKGSYRFRVLAFEPQPASADHLGVLLTHLYKIGVTEEQDELSAYILSMGYALDERPCQIASTNGNETSVPGAGRLRRKWLTFPYGVVEF